MNAPWAHGDPRDVARVILAEARYRTAAHAAGQKSFWDLLWDAVRAWWRQLLRPLGNVLGNSGVTNAIGLVVLGAVLLLLIVVVVRFARPYLRARRQMPRPVAWSAQSLADGDDAAALRSRALAAFAAGRHHEAAALFWAAALRALDERGRVHYDPARTPGEWRRAVRDPAFDAFARDAVVALFGDRPVDAALVERMRSAYENVTA